MYVPTYLLTYMLYCNVISGSPPWRHTQDYIVAEVCQGGSIMMDHRHDDVEQFPLWCCWADILQFFSFLPPAAHGAAASKQTLFSIKLCEKVSSFSTNVLNMLSWARWDGLLFESFAWFCSNIHGFFVYNNFCWVMQTNTKLRWD